MTYRVLPILAGVVASAGIAGLMTIVPEAHAGSAGLLPAAEAVADTPKPAASAPEFGLRAGDVWASMLESAKALRAEQERLAAEAEAQRLAEEQAAAEAEAQRLAEEQAAAEAEAQRLAEEQAAAEAQAAAQAQAAAAPAYSYESYDYGYDTTDYSGGGGVSQQQDSCLGGDVLLR
jgi:chemotaxis protein histidine kinase CheA